MKGAGQVGGESGGGIGRCDEDGGGGPSCITCGFVICFVGSGERG